MIYQYGNPLFPQDAFAAFSEDDKYRYKLFRCLNCPRNRGQITWCMLNPSTANAFVLDPTLRKCFAFSIKWGYAYMSIVNLFAYRSPDPKQLYKVKDPIGVENDLAISEQFEQADAIILGWGQEKIAESYPYDLNKLCKGKKVYCLGRNKNGSPKHPLYLPYTTHLRSL
jgi:hypothetical protein